MKKLDSLKIAGVLTCTVALDMLLYSLMPQ